MQKTFVCLNFAPIPARPFCHSYLNLSLISGLPGTPITPCPYGVPNGDGAGWEYVGLWEIVGCGVRVAECRVLRLLSSTQILFSILEQIKHKPTFFLCFTSHSKLPPPPTTPTSLFNSNSILCSCTNKTQDSLISIVIYSHYIVRQWTKEKKCASCLI